MTALVVVETVAVALLALLVGGLLRSHAEILRALHDLGVVLDDRHGDAPERGGAPPATSVTDALDLAGTTASGDPISVGVAGTEHDTLLAFLSSGCLTCGEFWSLFQDDALAIPGNARLVIATKGAELESPGRIAELAPRHRPVVMSTDAWDAYEVPVVPFFVLVDGPTGRVVGSGAAATWAQVASLIDQAVADGGAGGARGPVRFRGREPRADEDLLRAGIHPGHPSLHPEPARIPDAAE
ncbi:MAG: hypothetical protein JWO37_382 [Acidimicrobiales bacterium]|nr:hypothetical protein [Acidimicrobiales bacterium]